MNMIDRLNTILGLKIINNTKSNFFYFIKSDKFFCFSLKNNAFSFYTLNNSRLYNSGVYFYKGNKFDLTKFINDTLIEVALKGNVIPNNTKNRDILSNYKHDVNFSYSAFYRNFEKEVLTEILKSSIFTYFGYKKEFNRDKREVKIFFKDRGRDCGHIIFDVNSIFSNKFFIKEIVVKSNNMSLFVDTMYKNINIIEKFLKLYREDVKRFRITI